MGLSYLFTGVIASPLEEMERSGQRIMAALQVVFRSVTSILQDSSPLWGSAVRGG
jgi:hypothetical protein